MSAWTGKPCQGDDCPNAGRKGKKQADDKYCYRCRISTKKQRSSAAHDKRVQDTYGLAPGDYQKLYEEQGGVCAICRRATGKTRRLSVDHNHAIEDAGIVSVRGLLCRPCNDLLGMARDNPEFFVRAAAYLRTPPAWWVLGTRQAAQEALDELRGKAA